MPTSLRSIISVPIVIWIGLMVHLDWHVGRGHHLRLSLNSPWHWLLGVVAFWCAWWYASRKAPRGAHPQRLLISVLAGLFAGQVLEPLWEMSTDNLSFGEVYASNRWAIFLEFAAAGLATLGVLMLWGRRLQRTHSPAQDPAM